jgi:hypothetical protein
MATASNENSEVLHVSLSLTSCPSSQRIPIEFKSNASAVELYELISRATHIPRSSLKLIFRGKLIPCKEDEVDVAQKFKLEEGCVIHCMGKPVSVGETTAAAATSSAPAAAAATTPTLTTALNAFRLKCTGETYTTALKTLSKILENIMVNPNEEKYRKLKCSNATFMKRLGSLDGAKEVLLRCGFDFYQQEYIITPTAEKWELLTQARAIVDQRVMSSSSNVSAPPLSSSSPTLNQTPGQAPAFHSMQQNPAMTDQMRAQMMSNPVMMEEMTRLMSNPAMMEQMTRLMSNPAMMDQMRAQMMSNPAMMDQMTQLMSDPAMMEEMARMMSNPAAMNQMRSQMMSNPAMMEQMAQLMRNPQMMDQTRQMMGGGQQMQQQQHPQLDMNTMRQAMSAVSQMQGTANAAANETTTVDQEMTEEEMIQEAIRRSLQD